jgi:hypothetical protein
VVVVLQVDDLPESAEGRFLTVLKRELNQRKPGFTVEAFPRKPAGIGKAYHNMFLIYYVESQVKTGQWNATQQGEEILSLIQNVAKPLCAKDTMELHIGFSQGPMPYGEEKPRIQAWQQLVTAALLHLKKEEGGVFS